MSIFMRALYKNCNFMLSHLNQPIKWNIHSKSHINLLASGFRSRHSVIRKIACIKPIHCSAVTTRQWSTRTDNDKCTGKGPLQPEEKKPGLIQRFKEMYKNYWYVLMPVHMATSAIWLGSFYYVVSSGVDIHGFLLSVGVSETVLAPIKDSSAGYIALTFALYKVATPFRYAATLGGTTYAIKKLTAVGWIKPVPSRERLKEIIQEKKDNFQDRFNESKTHYQIQLKEKKTQVMDEMKRYKSEMRSIKNKVKKM